MSGLLIAIITSTTVAVCLSIGWLLAETRNAPLREATQRAKREAPKVAIQRARRESPTVITPAINLPTAYRVKRSKRSTLR